VPEWLIPVGIGVVIIGLVAVIWRAHELRDQERNETLWDQIGRDSEHGMRKIVHESANRLSEVTPTSRDHERRLERIERYLNGALNRESDR